MQLSKYTKDIIKVSSILMSLTSAYIITSKYEKPPMKVSKQQSSFNINNNILNYLNLGQKRLYSSLFWISTILESDHDHYKTRDLNSWMFIRFLTISNLEPKFLPTYTFGGPYLSIVKDDLEGASVIYDKGLSLYPNNFDLLSNAAFHYQFEKIDYDKSYPLYSKLANFPQSKLMQISSLARLESDKGNLSVAFSLLKNLYLQQADKNSFLAKRVASFLYAIKAEIDLNCLNSGEKECSGKDLNGESYLKIKGTYKARQEWIPYRTKTPLKK